MLLYDILLLPSFCGMYGAGIGVTGSGGPSRKERENNGLDVAIILDPCGLKCPNHAKDMCVQNWRTVILTRMDIANCEENTIEQIYTQQIFSERPTFRYVHLEIAKSRLGDASVCKLWLEWWAMRGGTWASVAFKCFGKYVQVTVIIILFIISRNRRQWGFQSSGSLQI